MNEIQKEIKFYEKLMGEHADSSRSYKMGKGGMPEKIGYATAQRALTSPESVKRFDEIRRAWVEVKGWKIYDPDRAKELRNKILKMEVR